jgi:TRAP-type C4-dicarboxylate transport system substrate-binding protein
MIYIKRYYAVLFLVLVICGYSSQVNANNSSTTLKIATRMPKGNIYHRSLQEVGTTWRELQGKNARFIIYPDGIQGTEQDTVRRMRIGQLDAAMLSVAGLKEIDDSVAALQLMPFVFRSWDEYDYVHKHLRAELEEKLLEKGFVVLFWGEGGWVHFFSTKPRLTPQDYKTARIFAWAGTPAQVDLMKSIGYQPVPLGLSDILSSLQTGMIDTVPASPLWALAFQFYQTTNHMHSMNYAPIVGATVVTKRTWDKLSPEEQAVMMESSRKAEKMLRDNRDKLDKESIEAMKANGLVVDEVTPEIEQQWMDMIRDIWPLIRGNFVPADMFDKVQNLLAEYRNQQSM